MAKPTEDQIRLRVAGIFYDETWEASAISSGPMTIETVMDYARKNTPLDYGFEYRAAALNKSFEETKKSMIQIAHRIDDPEFTSLGGKTRLAGVYRLIETPIPAGVVAWQYYVIGRDGFSRSSNPTSEIVSPPVPEITPERPEFRPYDKMNVQGGDTIIWRMVAICTNPAVPPARVPAR